MAQKNYSDEDVVRTPKELAEALFMNEKSVRGILRKVTTEQPGSGGRWDVSNYSIGEWRDIFKSRKSRSTISAELK